VCLTLCCYNDAFLHFFPSSWLCCCWSHPGVSQSAASGALAQAARLEAEKKYESASMCWTKADPKDEQPEVFLQKEKLLQQYYLIALKFPSHRAEGFEGLGNRRAAARQRGQL
jgi:hypothetical protein